MSGSASTPSRRPSGPPLPPRPTPPSQLPDPPLLDAVQPPFLTAMVLWSALGVASGLHLLDPRCAFPLALGTASVCLLAGLAIRHFQWEGWHQETALRREAFEASVKAWEADCERIRIGHAAKEVLETAHAEAVHVENERGMQAENARAEAQREEEQENAIIQGALLWWTTQRPHADEFVAEHWRDLIVSERTLLAQYADPKGPCSTMERSLTLARRVVPRMRAEVAYLLPDERRSVEDVAVILRRRHGFAVECLLPRAREYALQERLSPPPDPKLLAEARADAERLERERTIALREAGAWWTSAGRHYSDLAWLNEHVRLHRRWILRQIESARAAYRDAAHPAATYEGALELARWALEVRRGELIYHFGRNGAVILGDRDTAGRARIKHEIEPELPAENEVARILRAHHGHMVEVLIPMALETSDNNPRSIYGRLDRDAVAQFETAQTVVEVERVANALIERERARLQRDESAGEEEIPARVEAYAKFIREAAYKIKCDRGFITD